MLAYALHLPLSIQRRMEIARPRPKDVAMQVEDCTTTVDLVIRELAGRVEARPVSMVATTYCAALTPQASGPRADCRQTLYQRLAQMDAQQQLVWS